MIPPFLLQNEIKKLDKKTVSGKTPFLDQTIKHVASFISNSFSQWHNAGKTGVLQLVDARIKVNFLFVFVILISLLNHHIPQLIISIFIFFLYISSSISLKVYKKIAILAFLFGFLIFIPALFNVFSKGYPILTIFQFEKEYHWWIYTIPSHISVTQEGLQNVARITLKVFNSVSVVFLIMSTTPFNQIVKSLSVMKVPGIFLLTLTMTFKFIFILSQTVEETYRALKMRWWGKGTVKEAEKLVAGRIGYLFRKSWERYELAYQAMLARGYNGNVNFYLPEKLATIDYLFAMFAIVFMAFVIVINYWNV